MHIETSALVLGGISGGLALLFSLIGYLLKRAIDGLGRSIDEIASDVKETKKAVSSVTLDFVAFRATTDTRVTKLESEYDRLRERSHELSEKIAVVETGVDAERTRRRREQE